MLLSAIDIQNAVLRIFFEHKIDAGEKISLTQLESYWEDTGLRRNDVLQGAINLAASKLLNIDEGEGGPFVSLTEAGAELAQSLPAHGEAWSSRNIRTNVIPTLRLEIFTPPGDDRHRRSTDEPEFPDIEIRWPRN